jgi:hypothetical protein
MWPVEISQLLVDALLLPGVARNVYWEQKIVRPKLHGPFNMRSMNKSPQRPLRTLFGRIEQLKQRPGMSIINLAILVLHILGHKQDVDEVFATN